MASETTNYKLVKPDPEEFYDIGVQNSNLDKIDTTLKELEDNKASSTDLMQLQQEFMSHSAETEKDVKSVKRSESALRPLITFITDDGRIQDYTILKRFTDEYGVPFTSALISSRVGATDYMSMQHINELKALGWEFISHTHRHLHLAQLTEEEIDYELRTCVEWLKANDLNSDFLVYPFGNWDNRVLKIAARYHKASFALFREVNTAPTNPSQLLKRIPFGGDTLEGQDTYEFYKSKVDEAIANNGWAVFVIHSAYPEFDEIQQGYLADIIEYAQSQGVDIVNVSEGYEVFKNVWETIEYGEGQKFRYTALGANGDIYSNKPLSTDVQSSQIKRTRSITVDTRIDEIEDLPPGSHRYEMLHSVDNHGFPVTSGRLEIFRAPDTSDESFSYQLLSGNDGMAYYRYWQSSNNKWSGWRTYDYNQRLHIKELNELTGLELPSAFSVGITMGELNASQAMAGGLPLGAPGLLITEKAGNNIYVEQTYKHVNSNRMFVRGSNVNGNGWTDWQEVIKVEFLPADSITNTTNPSSNSLPVGVSYCEISDANDFPTGSAGLLITEKPSASNYGQIKQTFKLYKSNRQFVRSGNFSTSWTPWFEINMTEFTS